METIGADAAKLAGLQIDTLQKLRRGQITLSHWEWFNKLTKDERDLLSGVYSFSDRFELVNTFDIVVPDGYDHTTRLDTFRTKHREEFSHYDVSINDENFSGETVQLMPGRKFRVQIFQIKKRVSSDSCLTFLRSQKAVLVGAQGASLVYEQAREQFPVNRWSISFNKKDASLLKDVSDYLWVPFMSRLGGGSFIFSLSRFKSVWGEGHYLLCFCDPPAD